MHQCSPLPLRRLDPENFLSRLRSWSGHESRVSLIEREWESGIEQRGW